MEEMHDGIFSRFVPLPGGTSLDVTITYGTSVSDKNAPVEKRLREELQSRLKSLKSTRSLFRDECSLARRVFDSEIARTET